MTQLITQPTKAPTRKMAAVIIATFLVQGAIGVAEIFVPGIGRVLPGQEYIALLVPLIAGYMTKESA